MSVNFLFVGLVKKKLIEKKQYFLIIDISICIYYYHFRSCIMIHPLVRITLNVTAVYLCKRTMQNKTRLELADYEAENLARLQKMFSRKWEFIFMQAEAQSKVDKKRDKLERKVLDSQERAFWDVHRPMVIFSAIRTTIFVLSIKKKNKKKHLY